MQAKTVLYIDHYEFFGGGQHSLLALMRGLPRDHYRPLLAVNREGRLARLARESGIEVLVADTGRGRWRYFWKAIPAFLRMLRFAVDHSVSLVHSNGLKAAKFGAPLAGCLFVPCVWHKRIHVDKKKESSTARLWRFYAAFTDRMFAVSATVAADLRRLGIEANRVRVLQNFIDPAPFQKAVPIRESRRRRLNIPARAGLVGMIGARRHHKGVDLFLQAAALAGRGNGAWGRRHFVLLGPAVTGEEAYEASLRQLEKDFPWPSRLHVVGESADIASWLKSLDLLVCPSRREGFGRVVVEAMAAGCPVVAAYPEASEIVDDGRTGLLAPPDDAVALAGVMRRALADRVALRRRVSAAASAVAANFGPGIFFANLERLYGEVLREPL